MIPLHWFPSINAGLNAASAVCLLTGLWFIRRKRINAHRAMMTTAMIVAALFFVCYATYHAQVGSVHFRGAGLVRTVYFTILISHTALAVAIIPLALRTYYLASHDRIDAHRRLARIAFPIWLYVSVTGVIVYVMLYRMKFS